MKKHIARILTAAMLLGLLTVSAMAADSYGPYSVTDYSGNVYSFASAKTESRTLNLDWFGTAMTEENATVIIVQPGSTLTVKDAQGGEGYTMFTAYSQTEAGYTPLDGIRLEFGGTETLDGLFGENSDWSVPVVMLSFSVSYDTASGEYTDAYILLGDGAAAPAQTTSAFTDVTATAYYADAVKWAVEKGVTAGTSATTFSPDTTCTTAQILTFLWRANGSPAPAGSNANVPAGQYYSDAANWALEKGLTDTFNADTPATRAATVTYLWKLADRPDAGMPSFADVAADSDYAQAVAWAVKNGITVGTSDTTFSPSNTCTRGQIVTFLYRDLAK